jgi:hypothetical protein
VSTREGVGSTFTICLPLARQDALPDVHESSTDDGVTAVRVPRQPGSPG